MVLVHIFGIDAVLELVVVGALFVSDTEDTAISQITFQPDRRQLHLAGNIINLANDNTI